MKADRFIRFFLKIFQNTAIAKFGFVKPFFVLVFGARKTCGKVAKIVCYYLKNMINILY